MRCGFLLAAALGWMLTLVASRPRADEPPKMWGEVVPSQPFERQPFRPILPPEWVRETLGVGYTLSGQSSDARQAAAEAGVTISEVGFVDPWYPYYDSKLLKRRSPHVPLGSVEKTIDEYKRLGIRILGVYPPSLQGEVYENHPDWRRVDHRTDDVPQIDTKAHPEGGMLCLIGPYGDFCIDVLAEILMNYPDVDAFSFDGLHYAGYCYCRHCRDMFQKDFGKDIPDPNMESADFRRYQHWADRRMEDFIQRMQTRLKAIKPTVALVTWTTNAGRWGHFLSIPRNMPARMNLLLDAPDQELWLDETNRGASIVPAFSCAYAWAVTNHRVAFSEPYLMSHGNPYGKDSFPPEELERRLLLVATYGGAPSIAVGQPRRLQSAVYDAIRRIRTLKPWLINKRPEKWAALLMSDNTRTCYGRQAGRVEERYLANVLGCFRAGVEAHLPVTIINDWNLNDRNLADYKVLILPNAACMDDAQVKAVNQFVESGGGLVASGDVSLFNEFGDPRDNFALTHLLGVKWEPNSSTLSEPKPSEIDVNFAKAITPDYWEKRKNAFDLRLAESSPLWSDALRRLIDFETVTFKGALTPVKLDSSAQVSATVAAKDASNAPPQPAIILRQQGKGRVAYFAAGVDAAYYLYAYPYQRLLLRNAIIWAAAAPPPVDVKAPMCVHATICRQTTPDGDRLILQLFNDANTTAFHALPTDDVPLREETLPVHDIRITLRDHNLRGAFFEPEHQPIPIHSTGDQATLNVPRLDVHRLIAVELRKADD